MSRPWFHRRDPAKGEGIGFGIASWEGVVATIVFVALNVTATIFMVQIGTNAARIAGGVIFIAGLVGFLVFIRWKSDAPSDPWWPPT